MQEPQNILEELSNITHRVINLFSNIQQIQIKDTQ